MVRGVYSRVCVSVDFWSHLLHSTSTPASVSFLPMVCDGIGLPISRYEHQTLGSGCPPVIGSDRLWSRADRVACEDSCACLALTRYEQTRMYFIDHV